MKKKTILSIIALVLILGGLIIYKVINKDSDEPKFVFENVITTDRESMFLVDSNYVWYESQIELKSLMSDSLATDSIKSIINIFQHLIVNEKGDTLPEVCKYTHILGVDSVKVEKINDFVLEDLDMNNDSIKITFNEAFKKMKESGLEIPNGRFCVLRKELGPKDVNPQYIFGNDECQVYVDAITGSLTNNNPAYDPNKK